MDIKIAFRNILSLYRVGGLFSPPYRTGQIQLDLIVIQEICWTGHGLKKSSNIRYITVAILENTRLKSASLF